MSKISFMIVALLAPLMVVVGCVGGSRKPSATDGGKRTSRLRIGLSLDTLKEERWQRDRNLFVARAQELGADVLVQSANGEDVIQIQQAENLLTQGIDVLVIVPHNAEIAASIVESAKRQKVRVISYDRLVRNSDVDLYISFDNVKVGELQARYLIERAPKGNYILVGGAPTDNNAQLLREGQLKALRTALDRGDIRIVADQWARDWQAGEALKHVENALTQVNNQVAAVVTSNDGTAGGAIQALEEQKLAGKVLVSGQDADLAAIQRIMSGKQSMTVYKPIAPLARRAAEVAVAIAATGQLPTFTSTIFNGKKQVPAILLDPISVDKSNVQDTVIKDGFHTSEAVQRGLAR